MRVKTIVAGTTFGQFYMRALQQMQDSFELVGILAGGSQRSKRVAEEYGIPLYTLVAELPKQVELACVAVRSASMGGKGTELAMELLNRGIHVIQEQPIHQREIAQCFKVAKKNKVSYQVGDLYVNLSSVRQFIKAVQEVRKTQKIQYIEASCAVQVSYPLIDILNHMLPSLRPFKIKCVDRGSGPFHLLTADIGDIPVIFLIHNEINPKDPDNYMHLLHKITVGTSGGRICLCDTHGPVMLHRRLHVPTELYNEKIDVSAWPEWLYQNSMEEIGNIPKLEYYKIISEEWPKAVAGDLHKYLRIKAGTEKLNMLYGRTMFSAEVWHEVTNRLGYAALGKGSVYEPMDLVGIKAQMKTEEGYPWLE